MLNDQQLITLKKALYEVFKPDEYSLFIFGSRATNTAQKWSDIDVGVEGKSITMQQRAKIRDLLEDSDIPYTVDMVDFTTVDKKFKDIAKQVIIPL
jgi:predicted nucleotidyltransferase